MDSIKSIANDPTQQHEAQFQFHNGSIKSRGDIKHETRVD